MSEEIVLYYNPMSRARTAAWMVEEVGQPYRVELLNLARKEQKSSAFLAINPMGKLPTLLHRGTVVTEAAAICAYLADAFPAAGLAPPVGSPERGTYYRWLFFAAGCFEPAVIDKMLGRAPSEKVGSVGYGCYEDAVNVLEKALTPGPYVLGGRFSAADVSVGSQLGFAMMTRTLEERPAFKDYLARMGQRPAHQRALQMAEKYMGQLKATG
jgi:glutathione S-transferase